MRDETKIDAAGFCLRMKRIANELIRELDKGNSTTPIEIPICNGSPSLIDLKLFDAMKSSHTWPDSEAVQLVKELAAGNIAELVVRVDKIRIRGEKDKFETRKAIVGFKQTKIPKRATTWISDATADHRETEILAGCPIVLSTPPGSLVQRHPSIQIPTDIKKSTSRAKVVGIIRAVLSAIPSQFNRIGIICDQRHKSALEGTAKSGPNLDAKHRERIAKIKHFRSGSSRGSNEWHQSCDLLVVAGSPRTPPLVVKNRLLQLGMVAAACRTEDWVSWGYDYWSGVTTSGRRLTIRGHGYRDRDWQAAYRAIVASELKQSIGRGRGICADGIPVIVLSNEPLELPLVDFEVKPLTESEAVLIQNLTALFSKALRDVDSDGELSALFSKELRGDLSAVFPNNILGNCAVSSSRLAEAIGKKERGTRQTLNNLSERGLVRRHGERGGWIPSAPPTIDIYAAAASGDTERHTSTADIVRESSTSFVSNRMAQPSMAAAEGDGDGF